MSTARHNVWQLARNAVIVGASAVTLASLTAAEASAQNLSCGDTITKDTKLTSDLVDCVDDGVVIGASHITLDLNGHMIDGDEDPAGTGNGLGAGVVNSGHDRVTIKNGSIRQFVEGVSLENASRNHVTGLSVSGNVEGVGVENADRNQLSGLWLYGNQAGIELADADRNRIEDNVAVGNEEGIGLGETPGGNGSDRNLIDTNYALNNASEGIALENGSGRNTVTRSVAFVNEWGILVDSNGSDHNRLERNAASFNRQDGMLVGDATTFLRKNTANDNLDYGIEAFFGAIDGGGNRAAANGNAAQCQNVACL
jgi:parallel beta-helix repeat protein